MMRHIATLLGLCLLFAFGEGASVRYKSGLRRDLCSWGAQYWCSGPKTAGLCGKAEWCANNHWNRKLIPNASCSIIHGLIKQTRKARADLDKLPNTDYETARRIAKGCSFFKDHSEKQLCKEIVTHHEYLPKLVELIDTKLPVQSIAEAVGVCKREAPTLEVQPESHMTCEDVVTFTQKHVFKHLSNEATVEILDEICARLLPANRQQCEIFLNQYKPEILIILKTGLDPKLVCTTLGAYIKGMVMDLAPKNMKSPSDQDDDCIICEFVVKVLDDMLIANETEENLIKLLDGICDRLPPDLTNECLRFVGFFSPKFLAMIVGNLRAEQICAVLHLCPMSKQATAPVSDGQYCIICEFVMTQLDNILSSNATETQIQDALDQVCDFLPASVKQECDKLIAQYTPQLIHFLLHYKPRQVCLLLGLCTSSSENSVVEVSSGPFCVICEFVMMKLDDILADNATETQIEVALDQVCNLLPANVKGECDKLIARYTSQLIHFLLHYKPQQVCLLLGLCTSSSEDSGNVAAYDDLLCATCEFVMLHLDNVFTGSSSKALTESALEQVCHVLPAGVRHDCEKFVAQYKPRLIQRLNMMTRPRHFCTVLDLCTTRTSKQAILESRPESGGQQCRLCERITRRLEDTLGDLSTQVLIEAALEEVCNVLPGVIREECHNLVSQNFIEIVQLLLLVKPSEVCAYLGLCSHKMSETLSSTEQACELCEKMGKTAQIFLKSGASTEQIQAYLEMACTTATEHTHREQCIGVVKQYFPLLTQTMAYEDNPLTACMRISVCQSH